MAVRRKERLDRQALAAFSAATAQHNATVLRCHTGAKPVRALALQDARLECTLAHTAPVICLPWNNAGGRHESLADKKEAALYRTEPLLTTPNSPEIHE